MSIGTNTPFGFNAIKVVGLASGAISTETFEINPSNTTKIGIGDPVIFDSNGYVTIAATNSPYILGIFAGVTYAGANAPVILDQNNSWAGVAPTNGIKVLANVLVSPTYLFAAQLSGAGVTRDQLGDNYFCTFVDPTTNQPNSSTGQSTLTVDSGSFGTSSTNKTLKLVGLANVTDGAVQNDWGIQYNVGLFKMLNPYFS